MSSATPLSMIFAWLQWIVTMIIMNPLSRQASRHTAEVLAHKQAPQQSIQSSLSKRLDNHFLWLECNGRINQLNARMIHLFIELEWIAHNMSTHFLGARDNAKWEETNEGSEEYTIEKAMILKRKTAHMRRLIGFLPARLDSTVDCRLVSISIGL